MKKKILKAKLICTSEKVKVIEENGGYTNAKTGESYLCGEIQLRYLTHQVQIGFHIWRFGLFGYAREYLKYNSWVIIPTMTFDAINGADRYFDLEFKWLAFGLGIRLIWIKTKK